MIIHTKIRATTLMSCIKKLFGASTFIALSKTEENANNTAEITTPKS